MEPYYERDGIVIYHGDCRELLPSIDCSAVSLVVADPPYGETSLKWDRWPNGWTNTVFHRFAKKAAVSLWCFGSMRMFLENWQDFASWNFAQEIVWEKHNGSGFHTDRFRRVHELVAHFYRGTWSDLYKSPQFTMDATARAVRKKAKPAQWHGATEATIYTSVDGGPRLMRSVLQIRSEHGRALNETQKPAKLVESIVEYSCPPGGTILAPFAGSGTDLWVAKKTGRKAIGLEVREEQCEIAANRLEQQVFNFAD